MAEDKSATETKENFELQDMKEEQETSSSTPELVVESKNLERVAESEPDDKGQREKDSTKRRLERLELKGVQETGRMLGQGSFSLVVEIEYRGLKCAGKKLHISVEGSNKQNVLKSFARECKVLEGLNHPNVVQFLGIHTPQDQLLPTLVMELMYTALSSCLEKHGTFSHEISYSILQDVATALCYLHFNNPSIVHRDLTANNVLLSSDMRAKVGDLGVAKLLDIDVKTRLTKSPRCAAYLPPEVNSPNPQFGTEGDCFSFGVLILHTFCADWPMPDVGEKEKQKRNPPQNEASTRKAYLSKLGHNHPLKQLVYECLSDNPTQRPDAEKIQKSISTVASRYPPLFENTLQILQENQNLMEKVVQLNQELTSLLMTNQTTEQKKEQSGELEVTSETPTSDVDLTAENEQLKSQLEDTETKLTYETNQLRGDLKSMSTELVELNTKLTDSEKQRNLQGKTLMQIQEALVVKVKRLVTTTNELTVKQQQLENKEKQHSNMQEICKTQGQQLAAKDLEQKHTEEELEALQKEFNALQDQLKAKEGKLKAKKELCAATLRQLDASKQEMELKQTELELTAKELTQTKTKTEELLLELASKDELIKTSNEELDHIKMDKLPTLESQIQIKENSIKILSSQLDEAQNYIYSKGKKVPINFPLQFRFQKCADLPIAMSDPQCAVVNDVAYVGGGLTDEKAGTLGQGQVFEYDQENDRWNTLPDCPTRLFGLVQFCGSLLLLGGVTKTGMLSGAVYKYNKATQSWEESNIPPMSTKRFQMTVFSYKTAIAVCGGVVQGRNVTSTVEIFLNGKWQKSSDLPHRCCLSKPVIIGNQCYLIGGLFCISPDAPTKVVITTNLSTLFSEEDEDRERATWEIHSSDICQLTQYKSAPSNYGGMLLAMGGWDPTLLCSSADIVLFSTKKGVWVKMEDLPMARSSSTATTQLQNGQIFIVGGIEKSDSGAERSASVMSMSLYF